EELPLSRVRQGHPQVLWAGDAEHALLDREDVGLQELAVRVVKDVGDAERRLVLEAIAQVPPALANQATRDARHGIFAVIEIEPQPGGAVVRQIIVIAPLIIEIPN